MMQATKEATIEKPVMASDSQISISESANSGRIMTKAALNQQRGLCQLVRQWILWSAGTNRLSSFLLSQ